MPDLNTDIRYIRGIGENRAKAMGRLGIYTLGDLINYFPRAYEDRTLIRTIDSVVPEETACIRAMVVGEPKLSRIRRGLELVKLRVVDDTGSLDITFFNQSYIRRQLHVGETYVFYGRIQGSLIRNITLFAVLIYELVGPLMTKEALKAAGEIKPMSDEVKNRRQIKLAALDTKKKHK